MNGKEAVRKGGLFLILCGDWGVIHEIAGNVL